MEKDYWLHIIPMVRSVTSEPMAKVLLVGEDDAKVRLVANEYPHPGGAAPSRGYLSWEHLEKALRNSAQIREEVLKEAAKEVRNGMTYTIPNVKLDERQITALGLNIR